MQMQNVLHTLHESRNFVCCCVWLRHAPPILLPTSFFHLLFSYFPMQIEQSCRDVVNNLWRIHNQAHIGYASVRLMESIINEHRD